MLTKASPVDNPPPPPPVDDDPPVESGELLQALQRIETHMGKLLTLSDTHQEQMQRTLDQLEVATRRVDAIRTAITTIDAKVKANQRTVPNWLEADIVNLLKL